jgi:hypothetical protein
MGMNGGILRIGFDVGGVLTKYPRVFRKLIKTLSGRDDIEIWFISDIHPRSKIAVMLGENGIPFTLDRIRSADFLTQGEQCKAVVADEIGLDILIDDNPGYLSIPGSPPIRLCVQADPYDPYNAPDWKGGEQLRIVGPKKRPGDGG